MAKYSFISDFKCQKRGIYEGENLVVPFLSEAQTKEKHNLYVYAQIKEDETENLVLKFGKARDGIYKRYNNYQDITKPYNRCVWLGDSERGDEYGHKELQKLAKSKYAKYRHIPRDESNNTDENYEMLYGIDSVFQFIKDIQEIYNAKPVKEEQPLYSDIKDLVLDVYANNKSWNILYLCTRWGKTRTNLSLMQLHNLGNDHRISVMFSYVGTVRNSYLNDISTLTDYENIMFVDLSEVKDVKQKYKEIVSWLESDKMNHVLLYFALTGGERCFNERKKLVNKLNQYKKVAFVEEADFGAHCDNVNIDKKIDKANEEKMSQLEKVKNIIKKNNIENVYITTGTGYDKIQKFIKGENSEFAVWTKDYIADVLCGKI